MIKQAAAVGIIAASVLPVLSTQAIDVALVDHAIVMGPTGLPTPSDAYIDAAQRYLADAGYLGGVGDTSALTTPEQNTDQSYVDGLAILRDEVVARYESGEISADDPLYIFGYSQSAVIASQAQEYFAEQGIPLDYLRFVLVGNSAEPETGFMKIWEDLVRMFGFPSAAGASTPTDLYTTDSYVIQGDNWADANSWWPSLSSTQHLEYLGLTPDEIASATNTVTGSFTEHYIATDDIVNHLMALWDAWLATWGA